MGVITLIYLLIQYVGRYNVHLFIYLVCTHAPECVYICVVWICAYLCAHVEDRGQFSGVGPHLSPFEVTPCLVSDVAHCTPDWLSSEILPDFLSTSLLKVANVPLHLVFHVGSGESTQIIRTTSEYFNTATNSGSL